MRIDILHALLQQMNDMFSHVPVNADGTKNVSIGTLTFRGPDTMSVTAHGVVMDVGKHGRNGHILKDPFLQPQRVDNVVVEYPNDIENLTAQATWCRFNDDGVITQIVPGSPMGWSANNARLF